MGVVIPLKGCYSIFIVKLEIKEFAMNKRASRWGYLIVSLILILLMLGAGWWFLRSQNRIVETSLPTLSPVLVFLVSPPSGDEVDAGNFVTVTAQAVAPAPIQSTELFVDGQSLGVVTDSPQDAAWIWQALPVGIHNFLARSTTADGQVGESQSVIVNVLPGDGLMQVPAAEGQTLIQVGANFGVPPNQLNGANPQLDPTLPLPGGYPVQVPVNEANAPGGTAGNGSGEGSGQNQLSFITWEFKPLVPVDKSYCYTSTGDGVWEKMPKTPFEFFSGEQLKYLQTDLFINTNEMVIQMQCWGWLGGVLKYLGQGETQFNTQPAPNEVLISAEGFSLVGIPKLEYTADISGITQTIPPPFALREATDASDCASHAHPILAPFVCNTLMNASVKEYRILVWEWQPGICWPGDCPWINEINGYHVYEIDAITQAMKYLKDVDNPSEKMAAIPLSWTTPCYGVRAYVNDPAIEDSEIATYCPGQAPAPQKMTFTPEDWLTTGGMWFQSDDCDNYGGADNFIAIQTKSGFGFQGGEVLVGAYEVDDTDCFRDGSYSAGVKFFITLPPNAVIQKAELTFSKAFIEYGATGYADPIPTSCVANIGKARQDWSSLQDATHFAGKSISLASPDFNAPFASLNPFMGLNVDATSLVKDWIKHPENNHGFILTPVSPPHPKDDGVGECFSGLGYFHLDVYYFAS
jgi:hypothetical protein